MRQRQLLFKQAAEMGATVSPSKGAAFIEERLCLAIGGANRPGRAAIDPDIHLYSLMHIRANDLIHHSE